MDTATQLDNQRPRWLAARFEKPCLHCQLLVQVGENCWPSKDGSRYYHHGCALLLHDLGVISWQRPTCKHWEKRGYCLLGSRCFYEHPPDCLLHLTQQAALREAAAAPRSNASTRKKNRGPDQRHRNKNRYRASMFRRYLIDTFGRDRLREGSGVLDVAGGRGELAFELLNLNAIPATVVDPRVLTLEQFERRLMAGINHQSTVLRSYNRDRTLQECRLTGPLAPHHLRTFLDHEVVASLAALQQQRRSHCSDPAAQGLPSGQECSKQDFGEEATCSQQHRNVTSAAPSRCDADDVLSDGPDGWDIADGPDGPNCSDGAQHGHQVLRHMVQGGARSVPRAGRPSVAFHDDSDADGDADEQLPRGCEEEERERCRGLLLGLLQRATQVAWTDRGFTNAEGHEGGTFWDDACSSDTPHNSEAADQHLTSHSAPVQAARLKWMHNGTTSSPHDHHATHRQAASDTAPAELAALQQTQSSTDATGMVARAPTSNGDNPRHPGVRLSPCPAVPDDPLYTAMDNGPPGTSGQEDLGVPPPPCPSVLDVPLSRGMNDPPPGTCCQEDQSSLGVPPSPGPTIPDVPLSGAAANGRPGECTPEDTLDIPLASTVDNGCLGEHHPEDTLDVPLSGAVDIGRPGACRPEDTPDVPLSGAAANGCLYTCPPEENTCTGGDGWWGPMLAAWVPRSWSADHPAAATAAYLDAAIDHLLGCSVVVAMHPDQAAEFAVRLALALGKPFAVVPCCTFPADFPRRRLSCGRRVTTYEDLVEYLVELAGAERVEVRELPFEGRNKVITMASSEAVIQGPQQSHHHDEFGSCRSRAATRSLP